MPLVKNVTVTHLVMAFCKNALIGLFLCWMLCNYVLFSIFFHSTPPHSTPLPKQSWFTSPQCNENEGLRRSKAFKERYKHFANRTAIIHTASDLFPGGNISGDRILEQLFYVPKGYKEQNVRYKLILLLPYRVFGFKKGSCNFSHCPVNRCAITDDFEQFNDVDAVFFHDHYTRLEQIVKKIRKRKNQIWIFYTPERPLNKFLSKNSKDFWTATYQDDSDLVMPYGKWIYYDSLVTQKDQVVNYAAKKTKQVAWFVSNCKSRNGRLEYVKELGKYINVDIYGKCGTLECSRKNLNICYGYLERDYKFYLAFENSNCREYITEKFYRNSLLHNVLPIAMGADPYDYAKHAPNNSYILADHFKSPKELAVYLHRLDRDDDLYNSYFRWKGTGEFINPNPMCRLCALLHAPSNTKQHNIDLNTWWQQDTSCKNFSWKND